MKLNKFMQWRVYLLRGHSQWLIFPTWIINTMIIWYQLFFNQFGLFENIYIFSLLFMLTYFPLATYIGMWDFRNKNGTFQAEHQIHSEVSPVWKKDFEYSELILERLEQIEQELKLK